ncbi:Cytochrome c biogenesis protein DipZ, variant 2 [Balamuthia mandrillaris]
MIEEEHAGDRNHHLLEQKIVQIIWRNLRRRQSQQPLQEQPTIHPYNHETWYDAEFFMGKLHRVKNGQSKKKNDEDHHKNGDDDGCSDGVCTIRRPPSASASSSTNTAADDDGGCSDGVCVIRRPAKKESGGCNEGACSIQRPASAAASAAAYKGLVPLPSSSASLSPTYTVYGTGWCPFCRRSKALLEALSLPFQYVDMDHYGGAAAVKDILSSTFTSSAEGEQQPLLPASHKTIPIVYCDEKFIGGFSDLVSTLQQQADSKVTEELLQHVAEKAALHSFEFDKSGHKARVTLPLASTQWSTTDEYIIAKVDDAELELSFEMTIPPTKEGEQEKETLVSLYLVAEPPLSEEVVESRKELLERMKKKEGAEEKPPLALFVGDDKLVVDGQAAPEVKLQSTFQQQQVKLQRSDGQVVVGATIGWPDRHLVPELTSSSTSGSAKLLFPKGCKLYVLYFTTEPPRA